MMWIYGLLCALLIGSEIKGHLVTKPNNMVAMVGETVVFSCQTDIPDKYVSWAYTKPGNVMERSIYNGMSISHQSRYDVNVSSSSGWYHFVINSVDLSDAGMHTLSDDDGFGDPFQVELIVLESEPVCGAWKEEPDGVGNGRESHLDIDSTGNKVLISCNVSYSGKPDPVTAWVDSDYTPIPASKSISEVNAGGAKLKSLVSYLSLTSKEARNKTFGFTLHFEISRREGKSEVDPAYQFRWRWTVFASRDATSPEVTSPEVTSPLVTSRDNGINANAVSSTKYELTPSSTSEPHRHNPVTFGTATATNHIDATDSVGSTPQQMEDGTYTKSASKSPILPMLDQNWNAKEVKEEPTMKQSSASDSDRSTEKVILFLVAIAVSAILFYGLIYMIRASVLKRKENRLKRDQPPSGLSPGCASTMESVYLHASSVRDANQFPGKGGSVENVYSLIDDLKLNAENTEKAGNLYEPVCESIPTHEYLQLLNSMEEFSMPRQMMSRDFI